MLVEKLRDDEKRHHKMLQNLVKKPFFRIDPYDMVSVFRDEDFLEKRYLRKREFNKKEMRHTGSN